MISYLTIIYDILNKSTVSTEDVPTNPAMVLSVEESEVFLAPCASVHLMIWYPIFYVKPGILVGFDKLIKVTGLLGLVVLSRVLIV